MDDNRAIICPRCEEQHAAGSRPGPTDTISWESSTSSESSTCNRCGADLRLNGRFVLHAFMGGGGQSRTYRASDLETGDLVAVKELSLSLATDWKTIELFRRSTTVLSGISHPGIPRYVDSFEHSGAGVTFHYLVQELIDGKSFAQILDEGRRFTQAEVMEIAAELLDILEYLHGSSPPLVHRDIKPSNIMRRNDGSLVLIDFDIVQEILTPEGSSTVAVGTPGYAPLEQYIGRSGPPSDLHALGATLVRLLSQVEPVELLDLTSHRVRFEDTVKVGAGFSNILERLLEPDVAKRYQSARAVQSDLAQCETSQTEVLRAGKRKALTKRNLTISLIVVGAVSVPLWLVFLDAGSPEGESPNGSSTSSSGLPRVRLSDMASAELGYWHELEQDGIEIAFDEFDPVTEAPMVVTLSRSWASDAHLAPILAVHQVNPAGTVDLTSTDASVRYEFESPARRADPTEYCCLSILLENQTIKFLIRPQPTWFYGNLPLPICGLDQAIANLKESGLLPERPYYSADMNTWEGQTVWSIRARSFHPQGGVFPGVSHDSCRPR